MKPRNRAVILSKEGPFWARLIRQIGAATGRSEDAGDYLNSAWLRLAEYAGPDVRNAEAFLVRTAINIARDDVRRERRQALPMPIEDMLEIRDDMPLADDLIDARMRLKAVLDRLERMNPRTARIVIMHRVDGLTYSVIAQKLGISESAVEKHMAKAILALMKLKVR
ncbi:MAG: RNA polymerase subunit sigma-24 [Sphingomonas sanxanigenens]|uniref:RNA polymerase subunit sigma-24 n=1 Tax=Sphingomonas sanxanigenens TaxID=397260 RepID=A0A2W4ZZ53_9SPHN|nr:MAG: RNA polymerase subunit sigma-24 [Sphingomonas sanxanigenens]